jgi:hypothetical protein
VHRTEEKPLTTARRLALTAAFPLVSLAAAAQAAPCAGFFDVDSTDAFCPNVDWLKNRGVTVGCINTSTYCPTQLVTRAQMASFLNRLGNVMNTIYLNRQDTWGFATPTIDLDSDSVACPLTAGYIVEGSPRLAHGEGYLLGGLGSDVGNFQIQFVESVNQGAWTPVSSPRRGTSVDSQLDRISVMLPPRPLSPGTQYNYGLRVSRAAGGTSMNDLSNWTCMIRVQLENRNGTASPFDEAE